MYIVKYIVLCSIPILFPYKSQSSLFAAAIVISRSIRPTAPLNNNAYNYDKAPNNRQSSPPDDWEPGLREATYQAILRERNYHRPLPQLREDIARAPLLNKAAQATPFGDIAILARGQLYGNAQIGLTFVQDRCASKECGAYLPRDGGIAGNSDLLALWSVKRIRHRDNGLYKYEMEYTIAPINSIIRENFVTKNGRFNYDVAGHVFIVKSTQIDKEYKYDNVKYREYLPAAYDQPDRSTSTSNVVPLSGTTKSTLNDRENDLYLQLIDTLHKKTTHRFGSTSQSQGTTSESSGPIRESLPLPTLPTVQEEFHTTTSAFSVVPSTNTILSLVPSIITSTGQFIPSVGVPTRPTTAPSVKVTYMFDGAHTKPRSTTLIGTTSPTRMYFTNAVVLPTTKEVVPSAEVYQRPYEQESTFAVVQTSTRPFEQPKTTYSTAAYSTVGHLESTRPGLSTFGTTFEDVKPTKFGTTQEYSTVNVPQSISPTILTTYGIPTLQASTTGYHYNRPTYRPSFTEFIRPTLQTSYGSPTPLLTTQQEEGTPYYVTPEATVSTTEGDDSIFKGQGPYSTTITLQPINPTIITQEVPIHEVGTTERTQRPEILFTTDRERYFPTSTPHFITVSTKTTDAITGYPFVNKVPPFFDEDFEVFPENKIEKPTSTTEATEYVSITTPGPFLIEDNYKTPNKIDIPDGYNIFGTEEKQEVTETVEVPHLTIDTKEIDEVFGTLGNIVKKNESEEEFKDLFGRLETSTEDLHVESTTTSVKIIYENFFEASTTTIPPVIQIETTTSTKDFEGSTSPKSEKLTTLVNIKPTVSTKVEDIPQTSQSISTSITFEVNLRNNQTELEHNEGTTTRKDIDSGETLQAIESQSQSKGTTRKMSANKNVKLLRKTKIGTKVPNLLRQQDSTTKYNESTEILTANASNTKYNELSTETSISTNEILDNLVNSVVNNAKGIDYLQDVTTIRPIKKLKYRRKLYNRTPQKPVKIE